MIYLTQMDEQLISQIEDLGLSNKEARVYVANLILGPAGVQQIADTSGIKRVTTYVILESLVGLGLVSQTSKAKKTLFNAEAPENLQRLLEKKEQSIKEQKQQLTELLPQLGSLKTLPHDAPTVKLYDSAEGLRTLIRDYIASHTKSGDQIYGMSNMDLLHDFFPEIQENQGNPDRLKSGVSSKLIYTSSKGPIMATTDTQSKRQSRYVSADEYPINSDMTIVNDSVVLMSLSGHRPLGVTIQSKEIAKGLKVLFELAWESAGKQK